MTIRFRRDLIRTVTQSYASPALIPSPTFGPIRHRPLHNHPCRLGLHTSPSSSPPTPPPQSPTVAFLHQTHLPFRLSSNPHRPTYKQTPAVSCMVCKNSPVVVPDPLTSRTANDAHSTQSQRHRSSFAGIATTTSTTTRAGLIAVGIGIELLDHRAQSDQPVLMDYQPTHSSSNDTSSSDLDTQPSIRKTVTVDATISDNSHEDQSGLHPTDGHAFDDDTALSTSTVTTSSEASSLESPLAMSHDVSDDAKQPQLPLTFTLCADAVSFPHPDKAEKGGEDAFFVQKQSLGVFDGVGGWASIGVDAGLYSKELARLTSQYIAMEGSSKVVDGLRHATENNRATGSSTACVVGVDGDQLVGVNLGDSGLIVIRQGAIVYRTTEQQHYFNCPYQIGTDSLDTVDAGHPINVKLQHGDWIIMGTDGLWDNVFQKNVVDVVVTSQQEKDNVSSMESNGKYEKMESSVSLSDGSSAASDCSMTNEADDAQRVALELAKCAVKVAMDDRGSSPFAVNAQNAGHMFLGGKIDDITIVAALVVDPELERQSHGIKSSSLKDARTGSDENRGNE